MTKNFRIVAIIIALLILAYAMWYFKAIIIYILASAILAIVGQPIVDFITRIKIRKYEFSPGIGAAVSLVIFWTILIAFIRVFFPLIMDQFAALSEIDSRQVVNSMQGPIDEINKFFKALPFGGKAFDIEVFIGEKLANFFNMTYISSIVSSITSLIGNLFIAAFSITFITFFFLKEKGLFYKSLITLTPTSYLEKTEHFLHNVKRLLVRYFIGIVLEVALVGGLTGLGVFLAGLDLGTAVLIGLFAGFMNVIPYVGPLAGYLFGLLISLVTNVQLMSDGELFPLLLYVTITFAIVQLIDNVFFQPFIYSSSVNAHPLEIFLVISLAGSIGGVLGMFVAIPAYTILRVFAKEFFNQFRIVQELTRKIED
jgi:predicted PurR-regulated permease PerM